MTSDPERTNKLAGMAFGEALERLANADPSELTALASESTPSLRDGAIERLINAFEDAAHVDDDGVEFWTARTLANLLKYKDYRNFLKIIDKAKLACRNSGQRHEDHFVDVTEMVDIGSNASREIDDIRLTHTATRLSSISGVTIGRRSASRIALARMGRFVVSWVSG